MPISDNSSKRFAVATAECRRIASTFLDTRIMVLLTNAEEVISGFAEKAESDKLQVQFLDSNYLVKSSREQIRNAFAKAFQKGFSDLGVAREQSKKGSSDDWGSLEEWSLVDNAELSENVVLTNMIEEAENTHFSALYALHQRFSLISGGKVLEYEQMPVGPHRIVGSFRQALCSIELDQKIRLILYTLFRDHVLRDLDYIYSPMNQALKTQGILPNLKRVVSKQHSTAGIPKKPRVSHPGKADESDGNNPLTAEPLPSSDDLFESIIELMSARNPKRWPAPSDYSRSIRQTPGERGHRGPGAVAPSTSVVQAIDRIVQEGASSMVSQPIADQRAAVALAQDANFVQRTITSLSQEREQIIAAVPPQQMQPLDIQIIDIVGMLFEHMLNDDRLPNIAKAVFSRLQTPFLKAALIDKRLLHDADHPCRKLLNLLVEGGENFVNERSPDWGVFPALREAVDEITSNFKGDIQIFANAYDKLKPKIQAQMRKVSTLESRSKQVAQGQERFQNFKNIATARIDNTIGKHYVFPEVEAFLKNAWTDRLVFILLRDPEGENGDEWNRALANATFLADLSIPPSQGDGSSIRVTDYERIWREVDNDLSGLGGKKPPEWAPVAALLCNPKLLLQRRSKPKEKIEGLPSAGAKTDAAKGGDHRAQRAAAAEKKQASPQERKTLEKLQSLGFGTWFEFRPDPDSKPERHKLSWYSSVTGKCMFVDRTGVKSKEVEVLWLAREVLAQRAEIIELEDEPFFERALKSIVRMLKGSTGSYK